MIPAFLCPKKGAKDLWDACGRRRARSDIDDFRDGRGSFGRGGLMVMQIKELRDWKVCDRFGKPPLCDDKDYHLADLCRTLSPLVFLVYKGFPVQQRR